MLSAFLDDELTQAESQRVRLHLEDCADCRRALEELGVLREAARSLEFPRPGRDELDRLDRALSVRGPRLLGWMLVLVGAAVWVGYIAYQMATQELRTVHLVLATLGLGFILLLASVVRQRCLELPHDRYRRVRR